ncbi:hypothetical protein DFJ73DRAFT_848831, partial [Zopfochytrium polystomum]
MGRSRATPQFERRRAKAASKGKGVGLVWSCCVAASAGLVHPTAMSRSKRCQIRAWSSMPGLVSAVLVVAAAGCGSAVARMSTGTAQLVAKSTRTSSIVPWMMTPSSSSWSFTILVSAPRVVGAGVVGNHPKMGTLRASPSFRSVSILIIKLTKIAPHSPASL